MDAFVSYEQDFKELRDSIRKRVELIGTTRGDAKRKEISSAQEELEDAEEVMVTGLQAYVRFTVLSQFIRL